MANAQAPQAIQPGQLFDVPGAPGGGTQWQETYETTQGLVVTPVTANQVVANGILAFKQTDVVLDWLVNLKFTQTYTAGTSTLTASAYAPFNAIGPVQLQIQNQYSSVKVESGIDLYIFNQIRPQRVPMIPTNSGANPSGAPVGGTATGYYTTALAQANQFAAQWSTASTAWQTILRLPGSQWFDSYWDLAPTGEPVAAPHAAVVSPQYMAGTTRQITPSVTFNPGSGATTDVAAVNIGAGTGTYAGTANLTFKRRAIYAGQAAALPPVYAWQYAWQTTRFNASGVSKLTLPIPLESGQVLSIYVRFFDPSAAAGLGAPININTITKAQLQYGSGLLRFDDTPDTYQERWFEQHAFLLPQGVMGWDLALDERELITNKRALNLLTTAGCLCYFEFTAPLSATAYAVMGIESLVYVS